MNSPLERHDSNRYTMLDQHLLEIRHRLAELFRAGWEKETRHPWEDNEEHGKLLLKRFKRDTFKMQQKGQISGWDTSLLLLLAKEFSSAPAHLLQKITNMRNALAHHSTKKISLKEYIEKRNEMIEIMKQLGGDPDRIIDASNALEVKRLKAQAQKIYSTYPRRKENTDEQCCIAILVVVGGFLFFFFTVVILVVIPLIVVTIVMEKKPKNASSLTGLEMMIVRKFISHLIVAQYIQEDRIGSTSFGGLFKKRLKENAPAICIKTLEIETRRETFAKEASILADLDHPNIIKFIANIPDVCSVTEYMEGGNLYNLLRHSGDSMAAAELLRMCSDISAAMKYLESQHYVHSDLQSKNILLRRDPTGLCLKLASFAYAGKEGMIQNLHQRVSTPDAPELLMLTPPTRNSDAWAFGVVVWEIYTFGEQPYPSKTDKEVAMFVQSGKQVPKVLIDIVTNCQWLPSLNPRRGIPEGSISQGKSLQCHMFERLHTLMTELRLIVLEGQLLLEGCQLHDWKEAGHKLMCDIKRRKLMWPTTTPHHPTTESWSNSSAQTDESLNPVSLSGRGQLDPGVYLFLSIRLEHAPAIQEAWGGGAICAAGSGCSMTTTAGAMLMSLWCCFRSQLVQLPCLALLILPAMHSSTTITTMMMMTMYVTERAILEFWLNVRLNRVRFYPSLLRSHWCAPKYHHCHKLSRNVVVLNKYTKKSHVRSPFGPWFLVKKLTAASHKILSSSGTAALAHLQTRRRYMGDLVLLDNNGRHGRDGYSHGAHGHNGKRGQDGERGGDAGTIDISFSTSADELTILTSSTLSAGSRSLMQNDRTTGGSYQHTWPMGSPLAEVQLTARGGDGGYGGQGGRGGDGARGYPGSDATRYSSGGDGGRGGDGGDGGVGGDGGNAGHGGDIQVRVGQKDMDTLMLLKQRVPNTRGGIGGEGGPGGPGGSGGPGGPGGASYSWTESTSYTDNNGNQQVSSTTYTNPGGSSGPSGYSGRQGPSGNRGCDGNKARFLLHLTHADGHVTSHTTAYDLQLMFLRYIDSVGYKVIEPSCFTLLWVTQMNVGGMPTPSHQLIRSYVQDNQWVTCPVQNRVCMKTWLQSGEVHEIDRPIVFSITDVTQPAFGNPFRATGHMEHRSLVDRVNQDFARVRAVTTPFTIQYAAHNSFFFGATSISRKEESPLVYASINISALDLGLNPTHGPPRVVYTTVEIDLNTKGGSLKIEPSDVTLRDHNGNVFVDPMLGLRADLPLLPSNDQLYFSSTMQFVNDKTKPYTRLTVHSSLFLGHVLDMQRPIKVQIRPFEIQLAEEYDSCNSDFLLVVNNRTEYEAVSAWERIITSIGAKVSVWNVNLYGDLALAHQRKDGQRLIDEYRFKNIIYLNNHFLQDEKMDYTAVQYAQPRELYLAVRDHGINLFVFGEKQGFSMAKELLPWLHNGPRPVLFKSKRHMLKTLEKRLPHGEGSSQGYAADHPADLCGCLEVNGKLKWATLHVEGKTLCLYDSARQKYPSKMLSLERFQLRDEALDESVDIRIIDWSQKSHLLHSPAVNKYKSKHKKYSSRANYTEGTAAWLERLRQLPGADSAEQASSDIIKEGYLKRKSGEGSAFSYSTLYFRLDKDRKTLSWYKSQNTIKPMKILFLGRYTVTHGNYYGGSKKNPELKFQVQTPEETLFLRADSETEKEEWISAMVDNLPPTEVAPTYGEHSSLHKSLSLSDRLSSSFTNLFATSSPPTTPSMIRRQSRMSINAKSLDLKGPLSPTDRASSATVIGHTTISKIPIEERFFLTKPTEKVLEKVASKLQKKIQARFPNQRNMVVYNFDLEKKGPLLHYIGDLYVHRSLDNSTTQMVHLEATSDEVHSAQSVESDSTRYNLFKSLDFSHKLVLLNHHIQQRSDYVTELSDNLHLLVLSVTSDLYDEQYHFRESNWKEGLDTQMIRARLDKMDKLSAHDFPFVGVTPAERMASVAGQVLLEIGTHIKTMIKHFTSIWDKMLIQRRSTNVNKATKELWKEALRNMVVGQNSDADVKNGIKALSTERYAAWQAFNATFGEEESGVRTKPDGSLVVKDKSRLLKSIGKPLGLQHGHRNTAIEVPGTMTKKAFEALYAPTRTHTVEEDRNYFANDAQRTAAIDRLMCERLSCATDATERKKMTVRLGSAHEEREVHKQTEIDLEQAISRNEKSAMRVEMEVKAVEEEPDTPATNREVREAEAEEPDGGAE
ncbi:hypothetical protein PROFUN_12727 [Planoprotostelium fungivorum]|uniref:Non-specific protein-tyrosine kinase n=1 Tax=Planoprotostelium fungivorum TaxID=1890364 RepID=A0A2P6N6E7_9EUKA|nr:hypothetical protein PROFUN_12727 [Planoprotostelium fungivorum]